MEAADFHQGQPVVSTGSPLDRAPAAMVMVHGRGASAADILLLTQEFEAPDLAYLAPQAAGSTWYPNRFSAPVTSNEPWLSSALQAVADVFVRIQSADVPIERTLLLGFSQGACLALEFAARHPQPYGGVIGLSGALIENGDSPRAYAGSLRGVPVFLGCSTTDPHVPRARVEQSAERLSGLGADVVLRLYPNMDHTVVPDEIAFVRGLITRISSSNGPIHGGSTDDPRREG